MELSKLEELYQRKLGQKEQLEKEINSLKASLRSKNIQQKRLEKAHEIIKLVGAKTQEQLQFHISDITSLALISVFDEPYNFILDFVDRRGKTECDIFFERDGAFMKPINSSGGGAVDIAAFALRIASWSMKNPRTNNVMILDEPFRYLSKDRQEAASQMVKELSDKLGIQFIIVTHEDILASYADKVFRVTNKNGVSKVEEYET